MQNSAVDWGLPGRANSVFRLFTSLVPTLAELGRRHLAWGCWIASCLLGPIQGPELGTLESNTKYSFSLHHLSLCVLPFTQNSEGEPGFSSARIK